MAGRWLNAARAPVPLGMAGVHTALDLLSELESRVRERNFAPRQLGEGEPGPGIVGDRYNAVIARLTGAL